MHSPDAPRTAWTSAVNVTLLFMFLTHIKMLPLQETTAPLYHAIPRVRASSDLSSDDRGGGSAKSTTGGGGQPKVHHAYEGEGGQKRPIFCVRTCCTDPYWIFMRQLHDVIGWKICGRSRWIPPYRRASRRISPPPPKKFGPAENLPGKKFGWQKSRRKKKSATAEFIFSLFSAAAQNSQITLECYLPATGLEDQNRQLSKILTRSYLLLLRCDARPYSVWFNGSWRSEARRSFEIVNPSSHMYKTCI